MESASQFQIRDETVYVTFNANDEGTDMYKFDHILSLGK